jgi:hypothetical protein
MISLKEIADQVVAAGRHAGRSEEDCARVRAAIESVKENQFLKHTKCGSEVSIAVLNQDVALYVYCEHCHDLVEDGELDPKVDETRVRISVDRERVRPLIQDDGEHRTGDTIPGMYALPDPNEGKKE